MNQDNKKKKRIRLIRNIVVLFLSLVFVIFGSGLVYADMLLSQIHYNGLSSLAPPSGSISLPSGGEGTSSTDEITGDPNLLGGLYHDDAITNILLLGVDDYQDNDIGRSDSCLLYTSRCV